MPYGDQSYVTDGNAVRVRVGGKADEYLCKCTTLSLSGSWLPSPAPGCHPPRHRRCSAHLSFVLLSAVLPVRFACQSFLVSPAPFGSSCVLDSWPLGSRSSSAPGSQASCSFSASQRAWCSALASLS